MKSIIKILLIITISIIVVCFTLIYYAFSKPHRNIETETPSFILQANELHSEFAYFQETSINLYANKVVQIYGTVAKITRHDKNITIILVDTEKGVDCTLSIKTIENNQHLINNLLPGDHICLKGKCDGVDLIMGVVLTNCFICN